MVRIALLCNELPPRPHGGIGTFVLAYSKALAEAGHDVAVLEISSDSTPIHIAGVEVMHVATWPFQRGQAIMSRLHTAYALKKFSRRWRPDILEVPDFGGWTPWQLKHTQVVVRLHSTTTIVAPFNGDRVRRVTRWFESGTISKHPHWIACSKFILDKTIEAFSFVPRKSCVVWNPFPGLVDSREPDVRIQSDGKLKFILHVGHVNKRKGALDLAFAMKPLLEERSDLRLVYVGKDVLTDARLTSQRIQEILGDAARYCVFTGQLPLEQVINWYKKADVFVFPTHFEAFSLVYLEAIAAGVPIVASNRSSESEFLVDGETAFLVDPDDHETITNRVRYLLDNPVRARQMAIACKQRVLPHCEISHCVRRSVEFYEEVLACYR